MGAGTIALGILLGGLLLVGAVVCVGWYVYNETIGKWMSPFDSFWNFFTGFDIPFIPFLSTVDEDSSGFEPSRVTSGFVTALNYPPRTIHESLCFLYDKDIPFLDHQPYITSLHMEMYGVDDVSALRVREEYMTSFTADGYTVYAEETKNGVGWVTYVVVWSQGSNVRYVSFSEGDVMQLRHGHFVVVCTGYCHLNEYVRWHGFLASR